MGRYLRHRCQFLRAGLTDVLDGAEMAHERLTPCRPHSGNAVEHGTHLFFSTQRTVVFNGKPVRFILNSGDELEPFAVGIDLNLLILII